MARRGDRHPPRWLFAAISCGSLIAAGIYIGMMRASGPQTAYSIRALAFGALGLVMLYAAMAGR